jgi:hypothetical protein
VSVHVRRGDYLRSQRKGVLTNAYFIDAWKLVLYVFLLVSFLERTQINRLPGRG